MRFLWQGKVDPRARLHPPTPRHNPHHASEPHHRSVGILPNDMLQQTRLEPVDLLARISEPCDDNGGTADGEARPDWEPEQVDTFSRDVLPYLSWLHSHEPRRLDRAWFDPLAVDTNAHCCV